MSIAGCPLLNKGLNANKIGLRLWAQPDPGQSGDVNSAELADELRLHVDGEAFGAAFVAEA